MHQTYKINTNKNKWQAFELAKRKLPPLSPLKYQQEVKRLAEKLGV